MNDNKKVNAERVWKQFEDDVVPQLKLSVIDRAVYSHLLRHSQLEGKPRVQLTLAWLAHGTRLCVGSTRTALHRLFDKGALQLVECTKGGHVVEVRLPEEIRGLRIGETSGLPQVVRVVNLEEANFFGNAALRRALHERERGLCFYCLRQVMRRKRCLDHVVPRARLGRNSYRNLVSCCDNCNAKKRDRPAEEFLRCLYRERRLDADELTKRLRALDDLAAGKLKPQIEPPDPQVLSSPNSRTAGLVC